MLMHIASKVRSELEELLNDEGYRTSLKQSVLSAKQFVQLVQKTHLPQPLTQLTSQISIRIVTHGTDDIESIRKTIETHYHSVQVGWKSDNSQLTLKFLIPPQAKPQGYRERDDVPALMEISVAASQSEPRMTTDGESIPHLALIMKGGGIKGLAYVGALDLLRDYYDFNWFVGTSAGAITAILLAAGYSVEEMQQILEEKNFKEFFDAPIYMQPVNLLFKQGMHPAKTFTDWIDKLLADKLNKRSRVTLGDIQSQTGNRVTVYASQQRKKSLTFDSTEQPEISAAYAARCSMSIPIIFIPATEQGILAFDGGLQNNFPIRQLTEDHGPIPFVSLYLGSEDFEPLKDQAVWLRVLDIWMSQAEDEYVEEFIEQIVIIDPSPIGFLDFDINKSEKEYLVTCGRIGALKHLHPKNDHSSLPELVEATSTKGKLEPEVFKRYRRRLWISRGRWCLSVALLLVVLYALAQWWFTGTLRLFWVPLIGLFQVRSLHSPVSKYLM